MNKAQQMLATAGFPDTAAGRAAFHKQYPTPDSFFKVYGNIHGNILKPTGSEYAVEETLADTPETDEDTEMYKAGGGIHIKPSKRGTFTAAASKHGKSVQAFASQVLANKGNYSPAMVKKANFARNAAKWKHEDGGLVMYADGGKLPESILRSRLEAHMSPNEAQSYIDSYAQGGTVDVYQLMGMPTPPMYGGGSKVHPTLTLSTENNPNPNFKPSYSNNPFYNNPYSINSRTTLSGTYPLINNKLNLTGSYDAGNNNYTGGLEVNIGDILSGGGKGPSRKYDNPDIAHKGRSFLDTYGHLRAGVTNNKDGKVFPFVGGDFTVAHQMGRVKGPNGLRQPKGTIYASGELNNVENQTTAHDINQDNNYIRANLGGSYNFGKGLGVYGETGYDFLRKAPRVEVGLKKTFADGGHVTDYSPSSNFGAVQSMNNTYMHGFGYGGPIGKYDFGSTIKDIGAGAYGALEGTLDTVTMGATDSLTDAGYKGLQKLGNSTEAEIRQQDSIHGYGQTAGAITGAIVNPSSLGTAITEGTQGLGQGISKGSPNSKLAQDIGTYLPMAGQVAGMAVGAGAFGTPGGGAAGLAQTKSFNASDFGQFAEKAGKVGKGFNAMNSGDPMQMFNTFGSMGSMAMGGAVNAPNMMKYDDGGMTQGPTQINVEKGELLVNKDGKILTEYRAANMVPHPSDGSMDPRGTVPAQEGQFVITKRLAPNYKAAMTNNDSLYASAMRNNIAFDKQKKEAKQQAEQQAQQAEQEMLGEMMRAQLGGLVGQYGYGGGVMKYDGGSTVPTSNSGRYSRRIFDMNNMYMNANGADFRYGDNESLSDLSFFDQLFPGSFTDEGQTELPYTDWNSNKLVTNRPPASPASPNPYYEVIPTGGNANDGFDAGNATTPEQIARMDASSPQDWNAYARAQNNPSTYDYTSTSALGYNDPSIPPGIDPNYFNFQRMMPYAATAGLGLEALLSKPFNMNASDYQIKGRINPYEEEYRPDYRPYNAMMYSMNRNPNSDSLAGKVNLFNAAQQGYADQKYKVNQANLGRKMAAQQANLGLEGQNLATAMQIAQFNEQNKAARRNAIREQFGKNLPAVAYNERANRMSEQALSAAYPDYQFPWNKRRGV